MSDQWLNEQRQRCAETSRDESPWRPPRPRHAGTFVPARLSAALALLIQPLIGHTSSLSAGLPAIWEEAFPLHD